MSKTINVALIGNPNTGKTSVFNAITGLNQKVGNYPGITVEKKQGICRLDRTTKAHVIDLPGTYSLNASSMDESVVIELLLNKNDKDYPDVAVVISDIENLKRNLLLFTQIKDLEIPTLLVINMSDRMKSKGISLDIPLLEEKLKTKIALISTREKKGIELLKVFSILLWAIYQQVYQTCRAFFHQDQLLRHHLSLSYRHKGEVLFFSCVKNKQ